MNDKAFHVIFEKLRKSKRPVILAGTGVSISKMNKQFLQLIKKLKIPVVTGWNAHDLISNDNEYYAGKPGTVGDRPGNFTVQNSDLLIVLGCRLNIRQISYNWKEFAPKAFKIMVDLDQAELDKPTLKINQKIKADLKICPVKWIDEVFEAALQHMPNPECEEEGKDGKQDSKTKKTEGDETYLSH